MHYTQVCCQGGAAIRERRIGTSRRSAPVTARASAFLHFELIAGLLAGLLLFWNGEGVGGGRGQGHSDASSARQPVGQAGEGI